MHNRVHPGGGGTNSALVLLAALRLGCSKLWKFNLIVAAFLRFAIGCNATEAAKSSNAVTRAEALSKSQFSGFHIEPGFRLELAAGEPMVTAPVAIAFDENGRLFVAEIPDYWDRGDAKPRLGRVRVLEGMNDAGAFQTSTVYAEDLHWPSALACYAGGVFVAAAPDIFYFKDSKGDGAVDLSKIVLTGFGGTNKLVTTALPNSFTWGLDNRVHGVTAGIG